MKNFLQGGLLNTLAPKDKFRLLGEVTMLMMQSKLHCSYFLLDIYQSILPPIDLNQFRIYYKKNGNPVGFVSWAFLSKEKEERYLKGEYSVQINDWNCGDNLIYTDFIAPFGDARAMMKDLGANVFPNKLGKSIKVSKKGKIDSVKFFYGDNLRKKNVGNN